MKGLNLPLWEAHRLLGPTLGLRALPLRLRSGSLAFRWSNMPFRRQESSSVVGDRIVLSKYPSLPRGKGPVGFPLDFKSVTVVLETHSGLGTAAETTDTSVDYRALANILDAAFFKDEDSVQDVAHTLKDRFLASSPNISGCAVRIGCIPRTDSSVLTKNDCIKLHRKKLRVGKWTVIDAEHRKIPATGTSQIDSSETTWSINLGSGLPSDLCTDKGFFSLRVTLQREYQGTIPCSTPKSIDPELEALSTQALSVAAVPHHKVFDFDLHEQLAIHAHTTSFPTAEALTSHLADEAYAIADARYPNNDITRVIIKITRPFAGEGVGQATAVVRESSDRSHRPIERLATLGAQGKHRVIVALGANMGDRISNIEEACQVMDSRGISIVQTSCLYETEAMYVVDQDPFINGACEVETTLGPVELLDELKDIEKSLGRNKTIDKGPRNIDLDILLYDNVIVRNEQLSIPHKLMLEREFVLRPLCDLIPQESLPKPLSSKPFRIHLNALPSSPTALSTTTPISQHLPPLKALDLSRHTHIMAILNLTPDSFSDGGLNSPTDLAALSQTIKSHIAAGATILDIGGQSTRPGAPDVGEAEELHRVLPAITLIRSMPEAASIAISIDTYRARVAAAAVAAGADFINDVSAGTLDPDMLATAARTGTALILMHMRGTPETMTTLTDYPDGIVETVGRELLARVRAAEAAGVRRWRIVLDPGIGFAKTQTQNIELLRRLHELREYEGLRGLPWLVGASRKGFVGKVTGVAEPRERVWGTAAAVTAAVQGGADVVRVHDVEEMAKVVKMADAIWRG